MGCSSTAAPFSLPTGLAAEPSGNLLVSDGGAVRAVSGAAQSGVPGTVQLLAGTGSSGLFNNVFQGFAEPVPVGAAGYSGDGPHSLPAAQGDLNAPQGVAFDARGDMFVADTANDRVREVPAVSGSSSAS